MKKQKVQKDKVKEKKKHHVEPPVEDNEKQFDYGGLPGRDLKKNLGCG